MASQGSDASEHEHAMSQAQEMHYDTHRILTRTAESFAVLQGQSDGEGRVSSRILVGGADRWREIRLPRTTWVLDIAALGEDLVACTIDGDVIRYRTDLDNWAVLPFPRASYACLGVARDRIVVAGRSNWCGCCRDDSIFCVE